MRKTSLYNCAIGYMIAIGKHAETLQKGVLPVTIDDIAKELNISKTTVSRAISGKGRISEATRERVNDYINKINYRPSAIAQGLATSKTMNIGFVMPGEADIVDMPFFQTCIWGITSMAARMDYDVFISMVDDKDISGLVRLVENHKVDGLLLGRTYTNDKAIAYLKEKNVPFVTVGSTDVPDVVQVDNNDRGGACELTSLLLLKGMKRLALIGGNSTHMVDKNRLNGFLDGYERAGIPVDENLIYMDVTSTYMIDKIVDDLLDQDVDCIIGMDDAICGSILTKLAKENVNIPGDIKVASFFNSSLLEHNQPSITSLKFDVAQLGMVSCMTLLNLIDKKEVKDVTLMNYEVAMKESTQIV